jgi:outer membrane lipoprotein SlyB
VEKKMETGKTSNRIHPLVATAAVAVTLASLVGIAAVTGLIPDSHSNNAPMAALTSPTSSTGGEAPAIPKSEQAHKSTPKPAPVKARAAAAPDYSQQQQRASQVAAICSNCGRVESVQAIQQAAPPSGLGIAAGAVVGGLLGNQVGGGNGRTLATVAGAVGGGYAGNEVEKRTRGTTTYQVHVRMENGTLRTFPQSGQNGWQVGDPVRVVNGALTSRG